MKKTIKNEDMLRKEIYERVMNTMLAQLNESEVNELFGWGSGVSKPEQELTAEYIMKASNEELGETIAAWLNYWADNAKDSMDKALNAGIAPVLGVVEKAEDKAECMKKFCMGLVTSVRNGLKNTKAGVYAGAKALPRVIVMGIAMLIKLSANGYAIAKQAAAALYKSVVQTAKNLYGKCEDAVKEGMDSIKDACLLLCKLTLALIALVAHGVMGAKEAANAWLQDIIAKAKEKSIMAVLLVRSWFALKADACAVWVKSTCGSIKAAVVEAYNNIDKKVRKAWNAVMEKVVDWCNALQLTAAKLGEKVKETMTAAGDAIISAKDKTVVAGINKAVKMLSNKYSEDDVVAIVRKAYNEGLTFDADGRCIINECYYSNTHLTRI